MNPAPRRAADADPADAEAFLDDRRLIAALRRGDEAAFVALIERYHAAMVRLALLYVPQRAVAEEVAQETWLGVLQGLARFEQRSSLKTWIFRILTNYAKTRGARERRAIPFSQLENLGRESGGPTVDPTRFLPKNDTWAADHWAAFPRRWGTDPEADALAQETHTYLRGAIAALSPARRAVLTLRDIEGWSAEEVCNVLDLSETNQRVLLHRARATVRRAVERHFEEAEGLA